ncbi:hypothetical protein J6590_105005, partial [Homalodisca vitripennis]
MSFKIEQTKTGRPCIVFNNFKYRQQRTLKNGDVSWRCLGKSCGATIKTDPDTTTVTVCNTKHSGAHPATMRQLMSPQHGQATASPAPVPACSTPSLSISTPPSPAPSSLPSSPSTPDDSSLSPTLSDDLAVENKLLREKIDDLNRRVTVLLDHSIESDTRLLQYTDQVFVANNSSSANMTAPRAAMTVDCATQCEPPTSLGNPDETVVTVDACVQYESLTIPAVCDSEQCCVNRDLVHSLKTTVEVLEAEIASLKYELNLFKREERTNEDTWTKVQTKASQQKVPAKSKSKYDNTKKKKVTTKTSNEKHTSQQKTIKKQDIGFNTVVIRGDSHARYIAGLLGEMVNSEVTGVCKPGARLCDIIDHSPTPPVADTRCEVLIAGTNDLAS